MLKRETVIVLDFGGQYNQLIARRVRECNVYCEIFSYKTDIEKIKEMQPKGIIFTGGPNSVYLEDSPTYTKEIFELGIPVLGICYGAQLMMHLLGGKVETAPVREYGKIEVTVNQSTKLFENVSEKTICWMSHNDYIAEAAPGFEIIAHTDDCPVAAVQNTEKNLYAVQFHPEVLHTKEGKTMLSNFVYNVCECSGDWKMDSFVENLSKIKGFKYIIFVAKAFIENFVETGVKGRPSKVDIGPINTMISSNYIDGLRLRASAQTTANLHPHLFFRGYYAYGFKDEKSKYKGEVEYSFNKKEYLPREYPINSLTASYSYDNMLPSDKFMGTDKDNVFTSFKVTSVDQYNYERTASLKYELERETGLKTTVMLKYANYEPCGELFYRTMARECSL